MRVGCGGDADQATEGVPFVVGQKALPKILEWTSREPFFERREDDPASAEGGLLSGFVLSDDHATLKPWQHASGLSSDGSAMPFGHSGRSPAQWNTPPVPGFAGPGRQLSCPNSNRAKHRTPMPAPKSDSRATFHRPGCRVCSRPSNACSSQAPRPLRQKCEAPTRRCGLPQSQSQFLNLSSGIFLLPCPCRRYC